METTVKCLSLLLCASSIQATTMANTTTTTITESAAPSEAPAPGVVKGRIVDSDNEILPCASIYINEIQTGTMSDVNGFYVLPNLPVGEYTMRITYVGYEPKEYKFKVTSNKTKELNIVLDKGVVLKDVTVSGPFYGQRGAINSQKNSMAVVNVVSADQVGKFPDSNIGDALKRINGINVQYDQGEARFGQVRGTSADLSSVTIDGNRIPSAEGGTRNVQLDLIPADMVQTIEVSKVVTSDMDGDAIGGAINLITKNTPYDRVLNATVGSGYNFVSEKPQLNLGFTYGDRFLNNKLGVMFAASYQMAPGGSDNTEFEYTEGDDNSIVLKEAQVRQYYVTRERQSYSAAFDYDINANHKLTFKAIYNRRNDWENRFRISYKKLDSKASKQSVVLQTKAGDSDNKNARLERQQTMDYTLGGEHVMGNLRMDWAGSFSRATEDRPEERYFGLKLSGVDFGGSMADAGERQPYSTLAIPSFTTASWKIDELTNSNQNIYENEWKGRVNFELPLNKGHFANTLKFGAKYADKVKDLEVHCYDYSDAYKDLYGDEWQQNTASEVRSGFMPGSQYPVGTQFVDKKYIGQLNFADMQGEEVLEKESGNYHASERIASAYARWDQQLGKKWNLVAGLRMEHTALAYSGQNYTVDADGNENLSPTGKQKNNYTNWLPSLLVKYNANDDLKLRASFTKTLSRPKYSSLVPCVNYNIQDEEATIGNADLNPTTSYNYDLSGEYYFKSVGLVSLGVFAKQVQDVIIDEVWKGESAQVPASIGNEYQISKSINAYDATLWGVEVAYQRDFGFICDAMKAFGFYGTYTYTHSKTQNFQFEHRVVADGEKINMAGSPEHTANLSLYYENHGVNVRWSYNMASSFIDEMGDIAALDRYYDKVNYMDVNASYTWGKRVKCTIYADATNLLNQPLRYYQGEKKRTMQVEYYGVKLDAGIKIKF